MKLTKGICKLIGDLEYMIGSECYNPSSYDGWNDVEGCDFRYPVNVPNGDGEYQKVKRNINESSLIDSKDINKDTIPYIKYKFGANELYIGRGLINVLNYLEQKYDIDFNALEKKK